MRLWNKLYLSSILKDSFLCVKTFQTITTVINKDNNIFQFSNVPHTGYCGILRLRRDFVDQLRINKYRTGIKLPEVLVDFADWANQKYDTTITKLSKGKHLFFLAVWYYPRGFLYGPLLNSLRSINIIDIFVALVFNTVVVCLFQISLSVSVVMKCENNSSRKKSIIIGLKLFIIIIAKLHVINFTVGVLGGTMVL